MEFHTNSIFRFRSAPLLALLFATVCGCHAHREIQRKSIDQLASEAFTKAASRSEAIITSTTPATSLRVTDGGYANLSGRFDAAVEYEELPPIESAADQQRINEMFEQTDVREAIQILAGYGNQTVVIDETVGGVTSAQIKDDTFENALEKIVLPLGLVWTKRDGKYLIAPPDPDSPLYAYVTERRQFSPKYHDMESLSELLPLRFKQYIQFSKERNIAVIDAPRTISQDILQRLREIDQPIPQVELECIVCVVAPESGFRFGVDWGHVVGVEGIDALKVGMTGLTFTGQSSGNGVNNAFSDFAVTSAFVRLLAQEGYVTIRAAPRVTARDGEKASISIQRETFFSVQPSTSNVFFSQNIQKVDAGISMDIIPRIHGDMVNITIEKAEVSEDLRFSDVRFDPNNNPYPIINRRQVSTEVNVRDGNTIVIGGLVQRQTVDRINQVPWLSRIPVAGNLFRTVEKQEQDAEIAIFISPKIVPADDCNIQSW